MDEFADKINLEGSFGDCLRFLLLVHGTRPEGTPEKAGRPWSQVEFAELVGVSDRTVRNWFQNSKLPKDLRSIERVLFGTNEKYHNWRLDLRRAHIEIQKRKAPASESDTTEKATDGTAGATRQESDRIHRHIRPVPGFTGRDDLLDAIHKALWQDGGAAALTQPAAVKGLGGVGKSTLAQEYAWRNRERYCGVWWVRAEQADSTLPDDLIELGRELLPNLDETERDRALSRTLKEIGGTGADKPWLIIFDNAPGPTEIGPYLPRSGAKILITSRWSDWHGHATELPVEVFPPDVAADYLMEHARHPDRDAALRLAKDLGHLPLALSHARAYCWRANITFDDYRLRLPELIKKAPAQVGYERAVYATFDLAITELAKTCPEAERLMAIAAFLGPDRIPVSLFTPEAIAGGEPADALAALNEVSLITPETLEDRAAAFSVHRLVQAVMRSRLDGEASAARQIALGLMRNALDAFSVREHVNWPQVGMLLPHAVAVVDHGKDDETESSAFLQEKLGSYFHACGDYFMASSYLKQALAIVERVPSEDNAHTGRCLNNLALLYRDMGRSDEAAPLYVRALIIAEKVFGPYHVITCKTLNNLAGIYRDRGCYSRAGHF